MAADFLLNSMNSNDLVAGFDETELLGMFQGASDDVISALEGGNLKGDDSSADLKMATSGLTCRKSQDWLTGPVLGEEPGGVPSFGESNDELAIGIGGGLDCT